MARKKKLTPEQGLEQYQDCLMEEFERWGEIKMFPMTSQSYPL